MNIRKYGGAAALIFLPSVTWSVIFRQPLFVSDPLLFVPLEMLLPRRLKIFFRFSWVFLVTYGLLIRWGIYPEAYGFYLNVAFQSLGSPQSSAILVAVSFLFLNLFVPIKHSASRKDPTLIFVLALFCSLNFVKMAKGGQNWLTSVKTPTLRAITHLASNPSLALFSRESVGAVMYDPLLSELSKRSPPPKVLIIVLEAWGENAPSLTAVKDQALSMGFDNVTAGFVPYRGATLAGEVRVLCGQSLDYADPRKSLLDCLPRRLSASGYDTVSIHGNSGLFYYRHLLYPEMGFARRRFADELPQRTLCGGPFVGHCDDDVISDAFEELKVPGPRLVYVMSLSAHVPVSGTILSRSYIRSVPKQLVGQAAQTVNRAAIILVLSKARQLKERSIIYFVGDHNPAGDLETKQVTDGRVPFLKVHNVNPD